MHETKGKDAFEIIRRSNALIFRDEWFGWSQKVGVWFIEYFCYGLVRFGLVAKYKIKFKWNMLTSIQPNILPLWFGLSDIRFSTTKLIPAYFDVGFRSRFALPTLWELLPDRSSNGFSIARTKLHNTSILQWVPLDHRMPYTRSGWGGHLFCRFCKMFSESYQAVGLYCTRCSWGTSWIHIILQRGFWQILI